MMNFSVYKPHYKAILRLGVPIMLGQLGVIIVGFADNIMVGYHSTSELAAASFVNNFFVLTFVFGLGFSYGLTPIIGTLFSEKNFGKAGEILKNSLLTNFLLSIVICALMIFFLYNIHWLGQPEELMEYIVPYYWIQIVSVPFVLMFNSFKQFSDGTTDTVTPMWVMLTCNLLNIIGNYVLIYGHFGFPELGLMGAGISTLSSRVISFFLFVFLFAFRKKYSAYREGFVEGKINKKDQKTLCKLGVPVGLQMGVESASFSLTVIMMGWLGSIALAAHQVAGVITTLGFMIYYGFAAAVTIRVSNFNGQHDMKDIRRSSYAGFHLTLAFAVVVSIFLLVFRNSIGYIITPEKDVVEIVALIMLPVVLYQFGDGTQILFANALRGIEDVNFMAVMACVCHFGITLPLAYIFAFKLDLGPVGVWCGFPFALTVLGLSLWWRFNKLTKERNLEVK
jgi:MATE family multidrug resistance protein